MVTFGPSAIVQTAGPRNGEGLERAVAAFAAHPRPLVLRGVVQPYAWGGYEYIAGLLGVANAARRPYAELWIGTHALGPATTEIGGAEIGLKDLIERAPSTLLGSEVAGRFGNELPYLFKVLDVRTPLSIQAHPNRNQAKAGFARETAQNVPLSAPHRSYKDPRHKPEAQVALSEFWILHGFKPLEAVAAVLEEAPELRPLMPDIRARLARAGSDAQARREELRSAYERLMTLPQAEVDRLLDPLIARLERGREAATLARTSPDYWAARAAAELPLPGGHRDRGIASIYLLNLVRLEPGQGTFLAAGIPHAYLEGVTVEIMASSDNVLRGGLTAKHVDVPELLRTLSFDSGSPTVLSGARISETETLYRVPAEEFQLSRLDLMAGSLHQGGPVYGADSLIMLEGAAGLESGGEGLRLRRGDIVLVPAGLLYAIRTEAKATLFKASVPRP